MAGSKKFNIDGVTINRRIAESVSRNPDHPAISSKNGKTWTTLTYQEFELKVKEFSLGLRSLNIERGDRVALLSENRTEWAIADVAILAAGAITVPIYSTLPPAQVAHILADSGSKAIIASDTKQLSKAEISRARCPDLSLFITMETAGAKGDVLSFQQVLEIGKTFEPADTFEARRGSVKPEDVASLVYTSGTTGEPKGTMLTHRNFAAAVGAAEIWFPIFPSDTFLSFLPLCHVFERVTHYLSLFIGAHTYYAESIFKVQENMVEVHPVIMQSVPRLFEAMHERIMDSINKAPEQRKKMATWALSIGKKHSDRVRLGGFVDPVLASQHLVADKLVLSKIRERLGGKLRFFVSGGAPLSTTTADFFNSIDIPILEGYGMTETCAPLTCNPYRQARVGTVGKPFADVSIKIATDGEVLAKGPNVMPGYWNNPGATHEMFNDDGWLLTGDIGKLDQDGFLTITDRKKDIIVLANGKNVAPQPIEGVLKRSPYISEIVLLGDNSGAIEALVFPNADKLADWAKEENLTFENPKEFAASAEAKKKIKNEIERLSADLADFERVRKIAILPEPLTIDNGELTPTLKVRRKIVFERHGHLLD